jgi:putative DNA-invertase from lambdoid prophage Rac
VRTFWNTQDATEEPMSRVFAYCRVSTIDQTTENQAQEIAAAGYAITPQRIVSEIISGSVAAGERPGFTKLRDRMESGDVLIVTKLDRLGRNAMDVRQTVESLAAQGVRVHCLALGGADLTSPAGKMTMQVINAVAEFERDLLIERTKAGMARAAKEGKTAGRSKVLTDAQEAEARRRLEAGENVSEVARALGTSRMNVYRASGKYVRQRNAP